MSTLLTLSVIASIDGITKMASGSNNEIWSFGEENYEIMKNYILMRERLRSYIRNCMAEAHEKGTPIIRTMFYEFPEDSLCWIADTQYMFGPDILVAPIFELGQRSREVYLPKNQLWKNAKANEILEGGRTVTVDAPINEIPLFVRAEKDYPVYISNEEGVTFKPLSGEPSPVISGSGDYPGYVGQRAAFIGKYLYISYAAYNVGWSNWNTYGCDTGKCYDGALYRFEPDSNGEVVEVLDVSPKSILEPDYHDQEAPSRRLGYGISGICADPQLTETLICSTITASPDTIYRSKDYGLTWKPILSGLSIGKIDFNVSYQRPEYNGNVSLVHWMADLKINPFNSNMALFNTVAGIFMTKDLTKADKDEAVTWACCDNGVEETVHLNIYSPPLGDVKLIDIIGDYGGFVFTDLDKPAENTFTNHKKDRWITAMNADYPDSNPNLIVAAPRGNWTGKTKGGAIISFDQGHTWKQLSYPVGITEDIDE